MPSRAAVAPPDSRTELVKDALDEKGGDGFRVGSRFATVAETLSEPFRVVAGQLDQITVAHDLPDHSDVNRERYPWSEPYLSSPQMYAARLWEYPYAVLAAELEPDMTCFDLGCGMTAFTVYLEQVVGCTVFGVDPEVFKGAIRYYGHGVSKEFVRHTGVQIVQSGMERLPIAADSADRVFCLSVIEHLPSQVARFGMEEIARVLKPGGRAVLTVDVNMLSELSRPLDLIWDSGLLPVGELELKWPRERFGMFCDGRQPADVFGMVLEKDGSEVKTSYGREAGPPEMIPSSQIPFIRRTKFSSVEKPVLVHSRKRGLLGRVRKSVKVLIRG